MPIVFEEVTGEVAPRSAPDNPQVSAPTPETQSDLREKLQHELALLVERRERLFAD